MVSIEVPIADPYCRSRINSGAIHAPSNWISQAITSHITQNAANCCSYTHKIYSVGVRKHSSYLGQVPVFDNRVVNGSTLSAATDVNYLDCKNLVV
jgi:hypothetical protein